MTTKEQISRRAGWVDFLSTAVVSLSIWDGFLRFAIDPLAFASGVWVCLVLLVPFLASLLMAYFFVWRKQKGLATRGASIVMAVLLTVGIAILVLRLHATLYPVHPVGIS